MEVFTNVHVGGQLSMKSVAMPAGSIADADVADAAGLQSTKFQSQQQIRYSQPQGADVADDECFAHICRLPTEVIAVEVTPIVPPTAAPPAGITITTLQQGRPALNEKQTLTMYGTPTGGTFALTFSGQTTGTIAHNADAVTIQAALEALSNIAPGDVVVTGGALPGTPIVIEFAGTYALTDVPLLTANTSGLTGGSIFATVSTTTPGVPASVGSFTSQTSAADNDWISVTYGAGLFVAVGSTGTGNRVMTSPDGITWTARTSAADNAWYAVTYGGGLFVAVSVTGTGNRVMTSPDGITWTIRTSAADNDWFSVTYGGGLFVAVSTSGTGNRVMTSPDGITWTSRTSAADNIWSSVTYGGGLFVAVSASGTGNRVMTSPDGITWTSRTSAADNNWNSVTYGGGLFVAVAFTGTGNRVMTSPDGITWTIRTSAADYTWTGVTYGGGFFVAVSATGTGDRVMTSPDGITWSLGTSGADNTWNAVTFGDDLFVSVASTGTGNRVMISVLTGGTNEVQELAIAGSPGQGTLTLTFAGQTTTPLDFESTAAEVAAALEGLSNIGAGDVTCTGGPLPGTPVVITFTAALAATNVAQITANDDLLQHSIAVSQAVQTPLNEQQQVAITGNPTGGTFTLTFDGQTTAAIVYNPANATVDTRLEDLSNIGAGDITITGGTLPATAIIVEFGGSLAATNVAQMTADASSLIVTDPNYTVDVGVVNHGDTVFASILTAVVTIDVSDVARTPIAASIDAALKDLDPQDLIVIKVDATAGSTAQTGLNVVVHTRSFP